MMKRIFSLFLLLFSGALVYGQTGYGTTSAFDIVKTGLPPNTHVFTLPPNNFWYRQPWKDSVYLFPEFQPGKLEFANGFVPDTKLLVNYNIFLETIDVNVDGEISALKKLPEVKFVWVGDKKFLYTLEHGYLEIGRQGRLSVATRIFMQLTIETSNGYTYQSNQQDLRTATHSMARHYSKVETVYIMDEQTNLHRVGSRTLPTLLPQMKKEIKEYAKRIKVDYKKKEDVERLVKFCNENYKAPSIKGS